MISLPGALSRRKICERRGTEVRPRPFLLFAPRASAYLRPRAPARVDLSPRLNEIRSSPVSDRQASWLRMVLVPRNVTADSASAGQRGVLPRTRAPCALGRRRRQTCRSSCEGSFWKGNHWRRWDVCIKSFNDEVLKMLMKIHETYVEYIVKSVE